MPHSRRWAFSLWGNSAYFDFLGVAVGSAKLPAPTGALVATASRWPEFLKLAKTILAAAGFHADSLLFRDARKPDWQRGLKQATVVICDSLTAQTLPQGCLPIVFPLLSETSVTELRRYQQFITASL